MPKRAFRGQKNRFPAKNGDKNKLAEAGLEPARPCGQGILSPNNENVLEAVKPAFTNS